MDADQEPESDGTVGGDVPTATPFRDTVEAIRDLLAESERPTAVAVVKVIREHGWLLPHERPAPGASPDMTLNAILHRFWGLEPCETACTCIIKSGGRIDGHSILGLANSLTRATVKATKTAGLTESHAADGGRE